MQKTGSTETYNDLRFKRTISFLRETLPPPATLLDLGKPNPLGKLLEKEGYTVLNTEGDLDLNPKIVSDFNADATTAFEIFEHMVSPLWVLKNLPTTRLFASVPLSLWFAGAYYNPDDPWDRHYHEFEDWQFNWLLEKANWEIQRSEKWTSPAGKIGLRPLLRYFTPRHYIVEAHKQTT